MPASSRASKVVSALIASPFCVCAWAQLKMPLPMIAKANAEQTGSLRISLSSCALMLLRYVGCRAWRCRPGLLAGQQRRFLVGGGCWRTRLARSASIPPARSIKSSKETNQHGRPDRRDQKPGEHRPRALCRRGRRIAQPGTGQADRLAHLAVPERDVRTPYADACRDARLAQVQRDAGGDPDA